MFHLRNGANAIAFAANLALLGAIASAACAETPVEKPPASPPKLSWTIEEQKDKLDGKLIIAAQKLAHDTTLYPHLRQPVTNKKAAFQILCSKGKTFAYFTVDGSLVASSYNRVSYRLDEAAPVTNLQWSASEDHSTVGFWDSGRAIAFIKKLIPSKKIFIRIEHNVFGTTEAEFDTSELPEAIKPVRTACRW